MELAHTWGTPFKFNNRKANVMGNLNHTYIDVRISSNKKEILLRV
jgi:hypothetical protein